jgi:hypothetical protein
MSQIRAYISPELGVGTSKGRNASASCCIPTLYWLIAFFRGPAETLLLDPVPVPAGLVRGAFFDRRLCNARCLIPSADRLESKRPGTYGRSGTSHRLQPQFAPLPGAIGGMSWSHNKAGSATRTIFGLIGPRGEAAEAEVRC